MIKIHNWEKYVLNLIKGIYRKCTVNKELSKISCETENKTRMLPFLCSTLLDILNSAAKARKLYIYIYMYQINKTTIIPQL